MPQGETKKLGRLISQHRTDKGLSQRALADKAGISASDIAKLEVGYYVQPNPDLLQRVARVLGVDVEEFYAVANYPAVTGLPGLPLYMRSKYGLPAEAADQAEAYFRRLQKKYGLDEPKGGSDGREHTDPT